MGTEDYRGRCGNCTEFEFAGDRVKGYCNRYHSYYYPDDGCSHQTNREGSGSTGCFLTTVCCEMRGLADDCYELSTLRRYRDEVLKASEKGQQLVEFYYQEAPRIVEQIKKAKNKVEICDWIYQEVCRVIKEFENGMQIEGMTDYLLMMYKADLMSQRDCIKLQ